MGIKNLNYETIRPFFPKQGMNNEKHPNIAVHHSYSIKSKKPYRTTIKNKLTF
jgi:hypothetical protein